MAVDFRYQNEWIQFSNGAAQEVYEGWVNSMDPSDASSSAATIRARLEKDQAKQRPHLDSLERAIRRLESDFHGSSDCLSIFIT